jgi:hypothetical protein
MERLSPHFEHSYNHAKGTSLLDGVGLLFLADSWGEAARAHYPKFPAR